MSDVIQVIQDVTTVTLASDGPQGPQGPTGVVSVTAPITNTGTPSAAIIGINAGVANGVATLDSGGKVPQSQIPAVAITNTFVVASQAAMLALTAEEGDVAVRTDLNKTYILAATPASTLGNWQELLTPTDAVQSVDGRVGTVTLSDLYAAKTHASTHASGGTDAVTLAQSQITNLTTDLAAKAPLASPTFTGSVTIPAGSSISGVPYLATSNTFTTGAQIVQTGAAGSNGLLIQGAASQTADLQQWRNNVGATLASVTATGSIRSAVSFILSGTNGSIGDSASASPFIVFIAGAIRISTRTSTFTGLIIQGVASQTGNLQEWQTSAGTVVGRFNVGSNLGVRYIDSIASTGSYIETNSTDAIYVYTRNAAHKGFIVRGSASQSANLQEWQDSAGTVLAKVDKDGFATAPRVLTTNGYGALREINSGGFLQLYKQNAAGPNLGASFGAVYLRDGTNAGTLKLVIRAGAAGAETTILDNIPQ